MHSKMPGQQRRNYVVVDAGDDVAGVDDEDANAHEHADERRDEQDDAIVDDALFQLPPFDDD